MQIKTETLMNKKWALMRKMLIKMEAVIMNRIMINSNELNEDVDQLVGINQLTLKVICQAFEYN
ncbi:hypothetical protein KY289_028470 [Solanum tuberosum]|nr:hypothetical protein KY289_028470 [Solanum tuberosum]